MQIFYYYGCMKDIFDLISIGLEVKDGWIGQIEVCLLYGSIKENLNMFGQLEEGVRLGIFIFEDFVLICEIFVNINNQLEVYFICLEIWGVIYGDIIWGNLLVMEQGIFMIDFCLYGYGYYFFDVVGVVLIFNREEWDIFLLGYIKLIVLFIK